MKVKPKESERLTIKQKSCQRVLNVDSCQVPEAQEDEITMSRLSLALHLIGWKHGVRFLDQSQSEVKETYGSSALILSSDERLLNWPTCDKFRSFRWKRYFRTMFSIINNVANYSFHSRKLPISNFSWQYHLNFEKEGNEKKGKYQLGCLAWCSSKFSEPNF